MADVRADMVANVMEIYVTEGAEISPGDTIVLLESMKMEIPVIAEQAGKVSRLAVSVTFLLMRCSLQFSLGTKNTG